METILLAPDEPLSPELVLILPPALRAQALAALGPPVWPASRPRLREAPSPVVVPFHRSVTLVTLAMSLVAHAFR